ncbi:MAG: NifB/NifX family molybdenum-iron cluster-binding protein [Nanobdellota archaeon]
MKIAITCNDNNFDAEIDQRFGRCQYFLIADIEDGKIKESSFLENEGKKQGHGAGIKAAEQIGENCVNVIITGALGPNATKVLEQLNIKSYHSSGNVKRAIDDFINDKLKAINEVSDPVKEKIHKENSIKNKMFFPLLDNKGKESRISEHFGHAPYFGIYDKDKNEIKVVENDLDHTDPSKSPIDQIEDKINPDIIYAKSIGKRAIDIIKQKGILLKTSNDETIGEVINNQNNLKDLNNSCTS